MSKMYRLLGKDNLNVDEGEMFLGREGGTLIRGAPAPEHSR
jgi:hypothetical protein